jgi:hypothetical protein
MLDVVIISKKFSPFLNITTMMVPFVPPTAWYPSETKLLPIVIYFATIDSQKLVIYAVEISCCPVAFTFWSIIIIN